MSSDPNIVGVVGAGVMGSGVAESLARSSLRVIVVDLTEQALKAAEQEIERSIRLQFLLGGEDQQPAASVISRIKFTCDPQDLAMAAFVIENITERWESKEALYTQLDAICSPGTVFAANTSAISITRIAAATSRPAEVLGMHFMNPVPMKRTVELVRGYFTSEATIASAQALLGRMGKKGVVVADSPGFVTNRVLMPTINEAIFLVQERVAAVEDIDRIFKECLGHKMGPLETADLIGLDTILLSIEVLCESLQDSKYRPCPLLKQMVHAGLLGRKTGQGFYRHHCGPQ
jgi:3-hydroxybutyryl-CoA dehydrogenase